MTVFTGTVSGASKSGHEELFDEMKAAMCGYGTISNETVGSNVGNGTLTNVEGRANAVTETVTLTAQAGGLAFDVVGSVTGAMGTAYVDHSYDDGYVAFEINTGGIAFDEGDDFSFDVTEGIAKTEGTAWELLYESGGGSSGVMNLKGSGNSSDDAIYVYIRHFKNAVSGYYNWEIRTFTGYNAAYAETPDNQLGVSSAYYLTLWQNAITYWLVFNTQRFFIFTKVNTNYMSAGAGWYLPDGYPSEHPVPLFIGATTTTSTTLHSSTATTHRAFWDSDTQSNSMAIRHFDGSWKVVNGSNAYLHPWTSISESPSDANVGTGIGGGYLINEAIIFSGEAGGNSYGILDGLFYVSGFNNASENTFVLGSSTYIVFQNIFRTSTDNYCALRLE